MEEFWQNVRDLSFLILKVCLVLLAVDVASVVFNFEVRIPFIGAVTDWLMAKVAVFAG